MRVNHTYQRRGALAYLAAYDVHRGKVFGRTADSTGIAAFGEFVTQIMTQEPYASADRVFWIVESRFPVCVIPAVRAMDLHCRRSRPALLSLWSGGGRRLRPIGADDAVGECPDAVDLDVDLVARMQRFGAAG